MFDFAFIQSVNAFYFCEVKVYLLHVAMLEALLPESPPSCYYLGDGY